jgi:hypothetical protein
MLINIKVDTILYYNDMSCIYYICVQNMSNVHLINFDLLVHFLFYFLTTLHKVKTILIKNDHM